MLMNTIIVWLKRIFTIEVLGLMATVGSLLIAIHQIWLDSDGEPIVVWNGEALQQNATTYTYVYTSTTEQVPIAPLLATIDNQSQFAARDMSAKYNAQIQGVRLTYSMDYKVQLGLQGEDIRNVDSSLSAFEQMTAPINYAELTNAVGQINLTLRLTYNGIDTPFQTNQQIRLQRLSESSLQADALADARTRSTAGHTIFYTYDPFSGFTPLNLSSAYAHNATSNEKSTAPTSVASSKSEPTDTNVSQSTTVVDPVDNPTPVKVKKKGARKGELVKVLGIILVCGSLIVLIFMCFVPTLGIIDYIDDMSKVNFDQLKRAFNNSFDTTFNDFLAKRWVPDWIRSMLYGISLLCILPSALLLLCTIPFALYIFYAFFASIIELF